MGSDLVEDEQEILLVKFENQQALPARMESGGVGRVFHERKDRIDHSKNLGKDVGIIGHKTLIDSRQVWRVHESDQGYTRDDQADEFHDELHDRSVGVRATASLLRSAVWPAEQLTFYKKNIKKKNRPGDLDLRPDWPIDCCLDWPTVR